MTNSTEFPRGFPRKLEGVVGKRAGNTERKPGRVREETLGQAKSCIHAQPVTLVEDMPLRTASAASVELIRANARENECALTGEPQPNSKKERKKENTQPKGGMGERHAATTQGF